MWQSLFTGLKTAGSGLWKGLGQGFGLSSTLPTTTSQAGINQYINAAMRGAEGAYNPPISQPPKVESLWSRIGSRLADEAHSPKSPPPSQPPPSLPSYSSVQQGQRTSWRPRRGRRSGITSYLEQLSKLEG